MLALPRRAPAPQILLMPNLLDKRVTGQYHSMLLVVTGQYLSAFAASQIGWEQQGKEQVMSKAFYSASTQHKRAATDHETAARQHRQAAEHHDQNKLHAARIASQSAMECCDNAQKQSIAACASSANAAPRP